MEKQSETTPMSFRNMTVQNCGEPFRIPLIEVDGVSAESAHAGESIKVWTRLAMHSFEPAFQGIARNFVAVVETAANKGGIHVPLQHANTVLVVIKPDNSAELWVDTAAIGVRAVAKRDMKAGQAVFQSDIADELALFFPCVEIGERDKVICLFREEFSFGIAFDFNHERKLDLPRFEAMLGGLRRRLRYAHIYEVVADVGVFGKVVAAGWFPFIEIMHEFHKIANACKADFSLDDIETHLIDSFDQERLDHLYKRWMTRPHLEARKGMLRDAIDQYLVKKPWLVIKIVLTEIEGILRDAYRTAHNGQGARLNELVEFAKGSVIKKSGSPDTLMLPDAFADYLHKHTFANFDPIARTGSASSRHAISHGEAAEESYTMPRALQALLTLDQLAFFT